MTPSRTIPRATYIAVAFLGLFYAFTVWIVIQAFGADDVIRAATSDPAGLFFTATTEYVGSWAADLMHVFIVTSILASQLAFHNAINRYGLALSQEGVLPAALGRIHPRHRSPYLAGAVQSAVALVIVIGFAAAGADPYQQLLLWMNTPGMLGLLALQAVTAVAVPCYFRRFAHREGALRTVVAPIAATVLMLGALWLVVAKIGLMTGAPFATNTALVLTVPAAFVLGLLLARRVRRTRPEVYAGFAAEPAEEQDAPHAAPGRRAARPPAGRIAPRTGRGVPAGARRRGPRRSGRRAPRSLTRRPTPPLSALAHPRAPPAPPHPKEPSCRPPPQPSPPPTPC